MQILQLAKVTLPQCVQYQKVAHVYPTLCNLPSCVASAICPCRPIHHGYYWKATLQWKSSLSRQSYSLLYNATCTFCTQM